MAHLGRHGGLTHDVIHGLKGYALRYTMGLTLLIFVIDSAESRDVRICFYAP